MLADRYKIEEMIGEGAFASTYRATDTKLLRTVAVKLLRARHAGDAGFTARFEREARAAAQVSHPNVVQVHDFGRDAEHTFIVMHFVAGPTLAAYVREKQQLSLEEIVSITSQILDGLGAIHERNIVHRDIKPQNILLEPDLTPKLGDFGVAYFSPEASLTQTGTTIGTAAYMAPEQATGDVVGPAADLYAVGAVLYELTTGKLPFSGQSPVQVMYQHVNQEPTPPRQINPDISVALEAVILRALAKRPEQRFRDAAEMREALIGARDGTDEIFVAAPAGYSDQPTAVSRTPPPPRPPAARPVAAGDSPDRWPYALLFAVVVLSIAALLATAAGYRPDLAFLGAGDDQATPTVPAMANDPTEEPDEVVPTATAEPEPEPTFTPEPEPTPTTEPEPEPEPTEEPAPPPEPTATQEPEPEPEPDPEPTPEPEPDAVDVFVAEVAANTPFNPARIPDAILDGPSVQFNRDDFVEGGAYRRPDGVLYDLPAAHLYSQATDHPSTTVTLSLDSAPSRYAVIRIVGMDDESANVIPIRIQVNGYVIHEGPAPFGSEVWTDTAWRVGDIGALQAGDNTIVIEVLAAEGEFGRPPWLLLSAMRVYVG